jgi:hypothetical protein
VDVRRVEQRDDADAGWIWLAAPNNANAVSTFQRRYSRKFEYSARCIATTSGKIASRFQILRENMIDHGAAAISNVTRIAERVPSHSRTKKNKSTSPIKFSTAMNPATSTGSRVKLSGSATRYTKNGATRIPAEVGYPYSTPRWSASNARTRKNCSSPEYSVHWSHPRRTTTAAESKTAATIQVTRSMADAAPALVACSRAA